MLLESACQSVPTLIDKIKPWAETIEHIVVTLASIVAGSWAVFLVKRERGLDSALTIDIQTSMVGAQPAQFTAFDVTLTNVGKVDLRAKKVPIGTNAYADDVSGEIPSDSNIIVKEELKYSCSLIVKRLARNISDPHVDWFNETQFDSQEEVDLLAEYIAPKTNVPHFWMEPGEAYHLGVVLRLATGIYLAKVTFVGARNDDEFWSRTTIVSVP